MVLLEVVPVVVRVVASVVVVASAVDVEVEILFFYNLLTWLSLVFLLWEFHHFEDDFFFFHFPQFYDLQCFPFE